MDFAGVFAALISTASWAGWTILLKKFVERIEPIGLTAFNTFVSFIILFLVIVLLGKNLFIGYEKILPVALSGIIGIAIGDSFFYASLNRLSPIVVSVLFCFGPDIFSGMFGFIFLEEIPSLMSLLGIFAIVCGLSFLIFPLDKDNNNQTTKSTFTGILFAIIAIMCTAYSMVLVKPVLQTTSVVVTTAYRMLFGSLVLLLFGIISKKIYTWKKVFSDTKYTVNLSLTVLLATFGGFLLSLYAVKYCKLIIVSTIMSLQPMFIILFMIIFCNYKPQKKEYFGLFLIFVGISVIIKG